MSTTVSALHPRLIAWRRRSFVVGVTAGAVLIVGGVFDPQQFFRAYLPAYLFFLGIALGSMVVLMIYHTTGGAWGFLTRRFLEAAMRTLPLLAVGFVPIAAGVGYLYPWAQSEAADSNELLRFQQAYLNRPFFWGRAGLFFLLWLAMAYFLAAWSRAEDGTRDRRLARRCENLSGPGLIIYGISIHFASIDWLMCLQPAFHSTIFGPLVASGQLLSGHALAVLVLALVSASPPVVDRISPKALNDLGNLLLSFVMVWIYMWFFQYVLIWIADLPTDVAWYLPRLAGGWQWMGIAVLILQFAIPFLLLLFRPVKQDPRRLAAVAGLLLAMQLAFSYYLVVPAFPADALGDHWMDFLAPISLGGVWLAFFLWRIEELPLLPRHDLNEASAAHLRALDEQEAAWEESLSHG